MIELKNISKKYHQYYVFKQINYQFPSKGIIVLKGKNGTGKTSLLQLISGVEKQQKGMITYKDPCFKKNTSFLFHQSMCMEEMSIMDNIKLHSFVSSLEIDLKKVNKLAGLFNLSLNSRIADLSKGMRKKSEMIVSLSHSPKYIIWDEPFANLDTDSIAKIQTEILPHIQWGIISSHSHYLDHQENTITLNILDLKNET